MKDSKTDAYNRTRGSSLLENLTNLVTVDDEEAVAPLVEETADNAPNPFEQIGTILILIFFYVVQGTVLQLSSTVQLFMAHEVSQCSDKYYVQKYLDNVFWPFSMKILFAPVVDLIPLGCFKKEHHRKAYMITTGFGITVTARASVFSDTQ